MFTLIRVRPCSLRPCPREVGISPLQQSAIIGNVDRVRVDLRQDLEPQLRSAVDAIRSARVVAFPTDTLYGLAANPYDAPAVAAVFAL